METKRDWNGSMQHLVRRSGCEVGLHGVKGYEEQQPPVTILGDGGSKKNEAEEQPGSTVAMPWIKHFADKTGINSKAASTIISQLNNYHRLSSNNQWRAKNKVTPPSGAINGGQQTLSSESPTRKHPGDPPPLLLAGNTTALESAVGKSSTGTITNAKEVLSLTTKKGVPHVYHDYSNVPDVAGVVRKKTGGVTQPFPEKLHTMLDNDDDPSVVGWLAHGRAFLVRKPADFTAQIMPK